MFLNQLDMDRWACWRLGWWDWMSWSVRGWIEEECVDEVIEPEIQSQVWFDRWRLRGRVNGLVESSWLNPTVLKMVFQKLENLTLYHPNTWFTETKPHLRSSSTQLYQKRKSISFAFDVLVHDLFKYPLLINLISHTLQIFSFTSYTFVSTLICLDIHTKYIIDEDKVTKVYIL